MKDVTDDLFEDQGKTTQDANNIAPPRATKARDITEISFNRNATKRSHDRLHNELRVQSFKVQRMMNSHDEINQNSNAAILKNTFSEVSAQSAYVQATSSYYIDKNVEPYRSISIRMLNH
jgi:hypothetical protein